MIDVLKKHKFGIFLFLLFFFAFIFRLILTPSVFHADLVTMASWGKWIYFHGFYNFYDNNVWIFVWPNHPPLISFLYGASFWLYEWLNTAFVNIGTFIAIHHLGAAHIPWFYKFITWFHSSMYALTEYTSGQLMTLKLLPIISDLLVGLAVYKIAMTKAPKWLALMFSAIYLFSPFSWYESGLWGQNDQLGFVAMLVSFLLLLGKSSFLSPVVFLISAGLKPTSLILTPFFIFFACKDKKQTINFLIGCAISLVLYFVLARLISSRTVWDFSMQLKTRLMARDEFWTWVNTFNFWRVVTGYLTNVTDTFIFIPYKIWGYIIFGFFNIVAFLVSRKRNIKNLLTSLFILTFSGWLFLVTMHERYLFPAVVLGLILSIYERRLLKYWIVLSLLFFINMYNGWWFPGFLGFLKTILTWGNFMDGVVPKILAAVNVFLFFKMTSLLVSWKDIRKAIPGKTFLGKKL